MSKAATVYDVADRAGVSIATVSRVLRSPDAVGPVTRERVLDAVAALGYVPSGSARGLAERRTGVLGLYFPGFDAAEDAPPLDALSAADSEAPPFAIVREEAEDDGRHTSMLFLDEVLRGAELEAWKQGFVLMVGVGRDDPDRSTVRDMARLLRAAMQNEMFRTIFATVRYTVPPTDLHPDGFTMESTFWSELDGTELRRGKFLGGKTGYTSAAGLCLASAAQVKGKRYILVTAGAQRNHNTEPYHVDDAVNVCRQLAR